MSAIGICTTQPPTNPHPPPHPPPQQVPHQQYSHVTSILLALVA